MAHLLSGVAGVQERVVALVTNCIGDCGAFVEPGALQALWDAIVAIAAAPPPATDAAAFILVRMRC